MFQCKFKGHLSLISALSPLNEIPSIHIKLDFCSVEKKRTKEKNYIVTNSLKNIALNIEWAECWLTLPKRIVNNFAPKANVFSASGDINRCNQKHTTTMANVCKCIFVLVHMCVWYALNLHMFTNTFTHAHYNVNVNPLLFPAMCALTTMQSIMIPSSFFYPSICLYALPSPSYDHTSQHATASYK